MGSRDISELPIREGTIRLGQVLKLADLADDGLAAKQAIEDGLVTVNGQVETRRGRQLGPGDTVATPHGAVRISGSLQA